MSRVSSYYGNMKGKPLLLLFVILSISVGSIIYLSLYIKDSQTTNSKAVGSGAYCDPDYPSCEFFERCATEFTNPTCEYNPDWRNELTDDQKLQLREAFGAYGLDLSLFSTDPMERLPLGNYISLKPPKPPLPDNWKIYQDTVAKAVKATYPYLSAEERDEIVNELENAWLKRQGESVELGMNGLLIAMDIVTLPETLGSANALRRGAWNLIKNPTEAGQFLVKLRNIPEMILNINDTRSPSKVASLLRIEDIPSIMIRNESAIETDTAYLLKINSGRLRTTWGQGYAASIFRLGEKYDELVYEAKMAISKYGGKVNMHADVVVAATPDDFAKLYGESWLERITKSGKSEHSGAFWDRGRSRAVLRPDVIQYPDDEIVRLVAHEIAHQASEDVDFPAKVSKFMGSKYDPRVVEAFTEYVSGRATDRFINDTYKERVRALLGFIDKYVYDYMEREGIPKTTRNFRFLYDWLDIRIKNYFFSDSTALEGVYDRFYGKGKFGEILSWFFKDVSYSPLPKTVASENKGLLSKILSILKLFQFPAAHAAAKIDCCYNWPDEGELKKPFLDALQTSQDIDISEWDTQSFEVLLKMEWLRDQLNKNQKLTSDDFDKLSSLDFNVETEQMEKPEYIEMDSLSMDTSTVPFTPNPDLSVNDEFSPPDIPVSEEPAAPTPENQPPDNQEVLTIIPTQNIKTENQEEIIGNCDDPKAWVCEWPDKSWKNCLGTGEDKQGLFNNTYCDGQQM